MSWRIGVLLCFGLPLLLKADPVLKCIVDGQPRPVIRVENGTPFVSVEGKEVGVSPDADFVVTGDIFATPSLVNWNPSYTIDRQLEPVTEGTLESRYLLNAYFRMGRTEKDKGTVANEWPTTSEGEHLIVYVASVGGDESRALVFPTRREGRRARSREAHLDLLPTEESAAIGQLCFSNAGWLSAQVLYTDPQAQRGLLAVVSRNAESLNAAVAADPKVGWIKSANGETLIQLAAKTGFADGVRILGGAKPRTDAFEKADYPPLHLAARNGRAEAVKELLKWKPSMIESYGRPHGTPLREAVLGNHLEVVNILKTANADQMNLGGTDHTVFGDAINMGFADIAQRLWRGENNLSFSSANFRRVLPTQVRARHHAMVEYLIDQGVSTKPEKKSPTLLQYAAMGGDAEMVKLLLRKGEKLSVSEGLPPVLFLALGDEGTDTVEALLEAGADPNENFRGTSLLRTAAARNHVAAIRMLLKAGARLNDSDEKGLNALEVALFAHAADAARVLIAAGATVDFGSDMNAWITRALTLDVPEVIDAAVAAGWRANSPIVGDWYAWDAAEACQATRCLAALQKLGQPLRRPIPFVSSKELDSQVKVLSATLPQDSRNEKARDRGTRVIVEFIVDEKGTVLFPRVIAEKSNSLALSCAEALKQWTFTAPSRAGMPVTTRVRMPIKFPGELDDLYENNEADIPIEVISRVQPVFPYSMKAKGEMGSVTLEFIVGTDGKPSRIRPVELTNPLLADAAADAIREWKFKPAILNGKPVRTMVKQTLVFKLNQ